MKQKYPFDRKQFFRAILTIALPIALQNLLSTTAGMVDTIMIGSQGELAVAAVGTLCSALANFCLLLIFVLKDQKTVRLRLKDMFDWKGSYISSYGKKCFPIV